MRDRDIRQTLRYEVRREFCYDQSSRIIEELGLCTGSTRVDLAVVNGALHGYEIKSDQDTLTRLPVQVDLYSRVLDYATLVVGEPHLKKARTVIPRWWGIFVVKSGKDGEPALTRIRKAQQNRRQDPVAMAQLLWAQEALLILESHGLAKGLRGKSRKALWNALASSFRLEELGWMVRQALKARSDWRESGNTRTVPPLPPGTQILGQV